MPNVDFAILPLLATTLVFAIIELGLSAYSVSIFSENQLGSAPGPVNFLVFASLWTMLITPIFIALPMLGDRNNRFWLNSFGRPAAWVAPVTLAINAVTMIFWLAGFAALANLFGGYNPQGVPGALLAFAIMLWLIFLAILIFNLLTAFGILTSDRMGYTTVLFKTHRSGAPDDGRNAEKTQETSAMPEAHWSPMHGQEIP